MKREKSTVSVLSTLEREEAPPTPTPPLKHNSLATRSCCFKGAHSPRQEKMIEKIKMSVKILTDK